MVLDLIRERNRNLLDGITLMSSKKAVLLHSADDKIPSGKGLVRIQGRIIACRLIDHTHKGGSLLHCQVDRILAEECLGRSLDSVGIAAEEDLIHVHSHDLVLGVVALELYRGDPFLQLDPDHLERRTDILTRVEGLGELLGDGTSTSLAGVAAEESLDKDSRETLEIDTRMSVKTFVLCSYCSMNDIRRQVLVVDERSVLYMKGGDHLSI